jgi:muramoyltetrapeptide carboxypeptidase
MTSRRGFLQALSLAAAGALARPPGAAAQAQLPVLKPARLAPGRTVALVSPGSPVAETVDVQIAREALEAMGLRVKLGEHLTGRYGYLAATDRERARELNRAFADPEVDAVFAMRGGWGTARILPLLDYDLIRRNPRILLGYSDITALLTAVYARSGVVCFHGPMGVSSWKKYPLEHFRRLLFDAEALTLSNPRELTDELVQRENRVQTINPGTARGRLVGGNLATLTAILGSPYLPRWEECILFLEEVEEGIYRVDRMLTQLRLAGVLGRIRGFVFGKCTDCGTESSPGGGYGSLTLEQVFRDHLGELGIPAWSGAMIGHIADQWTVPVGTQVEIDAGAGTIRMLEPSVV